MPYLLGQRRGLAECATPSGMFVVLALDHRQNLRRELVPDDPDSVGHAEMVAFKLAVVRALAESASGVLLDPEGGVAAAPAEGGPPGRAGPLVAVGGTRARARPGGRSRPRAARR